MRRLVLLFLLCVLPLQFALAASVDARLHAGSGHHLHATVHLHEATSESAPDTVDADESSSRSHGECGVCHLFHCFAMLGTCVECNRPITAGSINPNGHDAHHRNATTARPERPNWSALV